MKVQCGPLSSILINDRMKHWLAQSCDSDFNSHKENDDSFSLNSDSFFHSTPLSTKSNSSEFSSTGSHSSGSSYESDMYECCMAYEAHRVGDPIQLVYANSETAFVKNLSSGSYSYIPINCIQSLERFWLLFFLIDYIFCQRLEIKFPIF